MTSKSSSLLGKSIEYLSRNFASKSASFWASSSEGSIDPVKPWLFAFWLDFDLPAAVRGPLLLLPFFLLASICLSLLVIGA